MTTNRKKLMKLLGGAQLRDFASSEEMTQAKALQQMMELSDAPPVRKSRGKKKDVVKAGPAITPSSEVA